MKTPDKQTTIRALMRNKDMAKLIEEASSSPIGSTPRKRAQKLVNIMRKVGAIEDGKNNPLKGLDIKQIESLNKMSLEQQKMKAEQTQAEKRSPAVFPAPPRMRISVDGKGGPGGSSTTPSTMPGLTASSTKPRVNDPLIFSVNAASNYVPPKTSYVKPPTEQEKSNAQKYGQNEWGIPRPWGMPTGTTSTSTPASFSMTPSMTSQSTPPFHSNLVSTIQNQANQDVIKAQAPMSQTQTGPTTDPYSIDYGSDQMMTDEETMGEYQKLMEQLGIEALPEDPYASIENEFLHSALTKNVGASGFAYQMMNNPKMLRSLPGFENAPEDALPYGASISGQVGALAETLRKESHLDSMMGEYMKMLKTGSTAQTDITDYIRGRDEYLNEVQGLIDDFKDQAVNMDMANPVIKQRAAQYQNYLYTLKGRQNKRYSEFLQASVTDFANRIDAQKQMIDMTSQDLKQQIEFKAGLAVDEYNRYYTILTDMYNQALGLPELEASRAQAKADLVSTVASIIGDASDAASAIEFSEGYIKTRKYLDEALLDSDGNMLPTSRNFADVWAQNSTPYGAVPEEHRAAIAESWKNAYQSDFLNVENTADAFDLLDTYIYGLDQYLRDNGANYGEDGKLVDYNPDIQGQYQALKLGVYGSAVEAAKRDMMEEDKVKALRKAVKDLIGVGVFNTAESSKQEFISQNSKGGLGYKFLSALFDAYEALIKAEGGNKKAAWQLYADSMLLEEDPGIDSVSDPDLLNNVLAVIAAQGMAMPL